MVKVAFYHQSTPDQPQLRLTVIPGQQVGVEGDASWIDWSLPAPSQRLGRSVTFQEDAQEWARSLPGLYNSGGWTVRVESDDAQTDTAATAAVAAGGVGAGTAIYGTPASPADRINRAATSTAASATTSSRGRSPVFVIGAVLVLGIAAVLAFKGLAGGKKDNPVRPPAMTQPLPTTPPATPPTTPPATPKPTPTTKLPTTPPTNTPPTTPPATTPPTTPPATTPPTQNPTTGPSPTPPKPSGSGTP